MSSSSISDHIVSRVSATVPEGAEICVGFSGGLDSTVLLDVLTEHAMPAGYKLHALHVNHGLSPNAYKWVKFCERFCANHGVPLTIEEVRVDPKSPLGLEAAARMARYAVYSGRDETYIALAHHIDDQAETVLLQLLRGTGLKGIAAMPELRELRGSGKQIFRPMLELSRAALLEYAEERGLRWMEDESNESTQQDRNFLRIDVAPLLHARFHAWPEALARFARHAGSAGELLDQLATLDGVPESAGEPLPLAPGLSSERRANVLRAFLARNAVKMPSEARLAEMERQLFEARDDARVRIDHGGVSIVRYHGAVRIERELAGDGPWRVDWNFENDVALGSDRGTIHFDAVVGEGIGAGAATGGGWYFAPRSGGESIRLGRDRPTKTLKNLFQEREISTWEREKMPLLFHGANLVWVPGIGIAAEYACEAGQPGLKPDWKVAAKPPVW